MGNANKKTNDINEKNEQSKDLPKEQKELIYNGEYSEIYKSKNMNNEEFTLKIINKNKMNQILSGINNSSLITNQIDLDKYVQEKINFMKEISSGIEYSIKINSYSNIDNYYHIEMEFCELNLRQYFNKRKKENGLDMNEIKEIFKKLNNVLVKMDEKKIFHGDIKPEHILMKEKNENMIIPKFTDYFRFNTFSKKFNLYNAPEIINNESQNNEINIKSDLWSIGLIMYELYFNKMPFKTNDEILEIIKNGKELDLSKADNEDFNELIENLLIINNKERFSFNEYINHDFWKDENSKRIEPQILQKDNIILSPNKKDENKSDKNNNKNFFNKVGKEVIFEFKTENYKKELNYFSKNDLKEVETFKFSGFNSKKSFLDDKIIIQWIKKLCFGNLKKLYLDGNDIMNIEGFKELILNNLTHLYINSNKIKDITEMSQAKFENLLLLDLSQNDIINIESLSKSPFTNLSTLNLSENKINDISYLKNLPFHNLKIINLSFNLIQKIEVLSKVPFLDLKSLFLNNNKITDIEVFNFVPFNNLENLNLSNNEIKNINSLKNSKLKSLKKLDLGFNKIENIEIILKSPSFDKLECLNICFNKIDDIDALDELKLKSIKKICIYGNDAINYDSLFIKEIINELKNKHINII